MRKVSDLLIRDSIQTIQRDISKVLPKNDIHSVFYLWAHKGIHLQLPKYNESSIAATVARSTEANGANRTYIDVAILGYAADLGLLTLDNQLKALDEGLKWMVSRPPFDPAVTPSFELSGIALLGIILGARYNKSLFESAATWFSNFAHRSYNLNIDDSEKALLILASKLTTNDSKRVLQDINIPEDIKLFINLKSPNVTISEDLQSQALKLIIESSAHSKADDTLMNIIRHFTIHWMIQDMPKIDFRQRNIEDLINLLKSIPHSLKRWPWGDSGSDVCWDFKNEYHVQSFLWSILAPIYPDLEDEEYLQSIGFKHPRTDLCIPSLRVIIEIKFIYTGKNSEFAKIEGGIAQDSSLYFAKGSSFDTLVAFIWDNSASTEKHTEVINGLKKLARVSDVIFISRPGKMKPAVAISQSKVISKKNSKSRAVSPSKENKINGGKKKSVRKRKV